MIWGRVKDFRCTLLKVQHFLTKNKNNKTPIFKQGTCHLDLIFVFYTNEGEIGLL